MTKVSFIIILFITCFIGHWAGKKNQAENDKWRMAACYEPRIIGGIPQFNSECLNIQLRAVSKESWKEKP